MCRYYGLWMWFPELFKKMEEGGSPCANVSLPSQFQNQSCYPVKTASAYLQLQSNSNAGFCVLLLAFMFLQSEDTALELNPFCLLLNAF